MFLVFFYAFGLFQGRDACLSLFPTGCCIWALSKFAHSFELVGGVVEYLGITMLLIYSINLRIALGIFQRAIHALHLNREVELRVVASKYVKLLVEGGEGLGQAGHHD